MEPDEYNPDNGLMSMPEEWLGKFYNACTEPCDMLIGPCACGAWHHLYEWPEYVRNTVIEIFPQAGKEMKAYLADNPWFVKDVGCRNAR